MAPLPDQVYLLCRYADQSPLYQPWLKRLTRKVSIVKELPLNWKTPEDAAILVTHLHYRWEELQILRRELERNRTPILILADGVLEYRNTWQHSDLVDGSLFQPVFGHKLACLGRGQARMIESWGNPGICEVVGSPALAEVQPAPARPQEGPWIVLVTTATTPAFDGIQHERLLQSLRDIQRWFLNGPQHEGRPIEVRWRLSGELAQEISIESTGVRPGFAAALAEADAVITTPSTVYLESVMGGRPTALLDYHNCPQYVPAAWTISASQHLDSVIPELLSPPLAKLQFQNFSLAEHLEQDGDPAGRMVELIEAMIQVGHRHLGQETPLQFPDQILATSATTREDGQRALPLDRLFPENTWFPSRDLAQLQIELTAAVQRLDELPNELAASQERVEELLTLNIRLRKRIRELHGRVKEMRVLYGLDPAEES